MARSPHLIKRITLNELETSPATIAVIWRHLYRHGWQRKSQLEEAVGKRVEGPLKRLMKAGFVERTGPQKNLSYRAVQGQDEVRKDPSAKLNEVRARLTEMHQMTKTAIETGLAVHAFEALRRLDKELSEIRDLMFVKHIGKLDAQE